MQVLTYTGQHAIGHTNAWTPTRPKQTRQDTHPASTNATHGGHDGGDRRTWYPACWDHMMFSGIAVIHHRRHSNWEEHWRTGEYSARLDHVANSGTLRAPNGAHTGRAATAALLKRPARNFFSHFPTIRLDTHIHLPAMLKLLTTLLATSMVASASPAALRPRDGCSITWNGTAITGTMDGAACRYTIRYGTAKRWEYPVAATNQR